MTAIHTAKQNVSPEDQPGRSAPDDQHERKTTIKKEEDRLECDFAGGGEH
jgi:hypothetical protein